MSKSLISSTFKMCPASNHFLSPPPFPPLPTSSKSASFYSELLWDLPKGPAAIQSIVYPLLNSLQQLPIGEKRSWRISKTFSPWSSPWLSHQSLHYVHSCSLVSSHTDLSVHRTCQVQSHLRAFAYAFLGLKHASPTFTWLTPLLHSVLCPDVTFLE